MTDDKAIVLCTPPYQAWRPLLHCNDALTFVTSRMWSSIRARAIRIFLLGRFQFSLVFEGSPVLIISAKMHSTRSQAFMRPYGCQWSKARQHLTLSKRVITRTMLTQLRVTAWFLWSRRVWEWLGLRFGDWISKRISESAVLHVDSSFTVTFTWPPASVRTRAAWVLEMQMSFRSFWPMLQSFDENCLQ